ncbi:hypothetical protein SCHPADRAFT_3105 [Schizopora paradoxa]|uniref:Uncharacterized protein n=1 Tax=Schizopora paradoxa TaxID=27342 RepID=A0A0H2STA2_9AGAM|nr:hypothetical protein SCHPADRAFT_3105 [Schizopora paradoxa]
MHVCTTAPVPTHIERTFILRSLRRQRMLLTGPHNWFGFDVALVPQTREAFLWVSSSCTTKSFERTWTEALRPVSHHRSQTAALLNDDLESKTGASIESAYGGDKASSATTEWLVLYVSQNRMNKRVYLSVYISKRLAHAPHIVPIRSYIKLGKDLGQISDEASTLREKQVDGHVKLLIDCRNNSHANPASNPPIIIICCVCGGGGGGEIYVEDKGVAVDVQQWRRDGRCVGVTNEEHETLVDHRRTQLGRRRFRPP